jgi:hypothetical protein
MPDALFGVIGHGNVDTCVGVFHGEFLDSTSRSGFSGCAPSPSGRGLMNAAAEREDHFGLTPGKAEIFFF